MYYRYTPTLHPPGVICKGTAAVISLDLQLINAGGPPYCIEGSEIIDPNNLSKQGGPVPIPRGNQKLCQM